MTDALSRPAQVKSRMRSRIVLVRHGETAWSVTGQHTGRTDIPLTDQGEQQARRLAELLRTVAFAHVLTSPLQRARRTCELAGLAQVARVDPNLVEWDYGEYDSLTLSDIRAQRPGWTVFHDGCPGGESPSQVAHRADLVVDALRRLEGAVAVFSHGHFLRGLALRWIGLPIGEGRHLNLDTASLSVLGYDHRDVDVPVVSLWNAVSNELFDLTAHVS
jgi:broad specificity phosphatase PhoE